MESPDTGKIYYSKVNAGKFEKVFREFMDDALPFGLAEEEIQKVHDACLGALKSLGLKHNENDARQVMFDAAEKVLGKARFDETLAFLIH